MVRCVTRLLFSEYFAVFHSHVLFDLLDSVVNVLVTNFDHVLFLNDVEDISYGEFAFDEKVHLF